VKKLIVRGIFTSFGIRTDNAQDARSAGRSALMSPFGYGGVKIDWETGRQKDREIRSREKVRA
jgi:hypothetical protein